MLAAVVGSLVTPRPAAAESGSAAPQEKATAFDEPLPKFVDLGNLNDFAGDVGDINNKGQVAAALRPWPDARARAVLLSAGSGGAGTQITDIQSSLSGDVLFSSAGDVNDDGTAVGRYTFRKSDGSTGHANFVYKDGTATRLDLQYSVMAINNRGQIINSREVLDIDGSLLKLEPFKGQRVEAFAINEAGEVVGGADMDPSPTAVEFVAFRTRPGEPIDVKRDRLDFHGSTVAYDINDKGQVAGYGNDDVSDGYVPIIWNKDGVPRKIGTPHGGVMYAINNDGVGAGIMFDSNGSYRAAVYTENGPFDLNDVVPEETRKGMTLTKSVGINDLGQIVGIAKDHENHAHAFLLDLGIKKPAVSLSIKTRRYPSDEWLDVSPGTGRTIDGNQVRLDVEITNPNGDKTLSRKLRVVEQVSGKPVPGGEIDVVLAPGKTLRKQMTWDTEGYAWHKGQASSDRALVAQILTADGSVEVTSRTEPVVILPKPVVLVHGWKSDAATAWGNYGPILKSGHPELRGFAVGDGQVPGTLDTGTLSDPGKLTMTVSGNAEQLATYIEGVRGRTGAFHVDALAHSMGGVITRQYVQDNMPNSPDGKPVVSRMLQMGTPNEGSLYADLLVLAHEVKGLQPPFFPATLEITTSQMRSFNKLVTNLRGVKPSNLVGVGWPVLSADEEDGVFEDGDGIVAASSARFIYIDVPTTGTPHLGMTESPGDFLTYVKPRLASLLAYVGNPDGAEPTLKRDAAAKPGKTTAAAAAGDGDAAAEAATAAVSVFATPSAVVEAGKTVSVPVEVPAGTRFGVTGVLPQTVGLLLRDPSGKAVASYAAGGDAARQPVQGLSVTAPQAGAWKLEVTNTGTAPVMAELGAWIAGSTVRVAAAAEVSEDGRVAVTATVTDGGQPVTGAMVKAILRGQDGARHELTFKDDGAAGDGVYAATSEALADGVYNLVVKAETAKWLRTTLESVKVAKPDLREFELKLSADPGGSVTASPALEKYRAGTTVTLTPAAEAGRIPAGWVVDGQERPAGTLRLVMDGPHEVVARFGSYTVTELGGAAGRSAEFTKAAALNDRGQVAVTIEAPGTAGRRHAMRWQDGTFTELGGLACTDQNGPACDAHATGINEAGEVSGAAHTQVNGVNEAHAVTWRADGTVRDLQPDSGPPRTTGWAWDLNDNDQVFGTLGGKHVMWDQGPAIQLPDEPEFDWRPGSAVLYPRINGRGQVAGGYVTDRGVDGIPAGWNPALYQNGTVTTLGDPACPFTETQHPAGHAYDVNAAGVVAGELMCRANRDASHAYVWREGRPTDLGVGRATAVSDAGLVAGLTAEASP
ncbi:DUF7379 domain-containing protein, partial [Streptosporangium fragile]|uniref:DUF7379 domain-containing protein n=1 Tax=Streptosporangium fragile TaxID=46186 RepID=UPI003CD06BB4